MEVTNSLLPAMASCCSAVFHYFLDSEVLLDLTSLLIISQILGMPLPMKDYVCFSKTHLWSFFLILPGSKILQCFPWIFSWVLIHKLNHFHRVYVLKSQPHELVFHWGVDSCFSESYTQENASLLWASQESQSYVSCNFKMICAVAAFISEEDYCRVFRILCPSCHEWDLHSSPEVLTGFLFIWGFEQQTSSGEFAQAFLYGHGRDPESNLSQFTPAQIMNTFLLFPS